MELDNLRIDQPVLFKMARRWTVIDTRPVEEFEAGHLPGALNIPLPDLKRRLRELPRDREIVAYCRGPYCVLSYEAVAELRRRGFNASRLEHGYPEWRVAGLSVEHLTNTDLLSEKPPCLERNSAQVFFGLHAV